MYNYTLDPDGTVRFMSRGREIRVTDSQPGNTRFLKKHSEKRSQSVLGLLYKEHESDWGSVLLLLLPLLLPRMLLLPKEFRRGWPEGWPQ